MTELRKVRKAHGLTGFEVGHQIGIRPQTLYRYESGERKLPVKVAKILGTYYGVPWSSFYEGEGDGETTVG